MSTKNDTSKTPALDTFGRNLSKLANEGKLEPVTGRDSEIQRVIQILGRKKKNNPILVGEPGVGKTAIVEGLALKIFDGEVPTYLTNKKIYELSINSVVAGTKYRGEFEARMQQIMKEITQSNGQIIMFIDELHTMVGAGSASGSLDAANILKPALSRGELSIIGSTTYKEYREHIEKDGALSRRFEKVNVEEPSLELTLQIIKGALPLYETFHRVKFSEPLIKLILNLADRYLPYKRFPDKAFDLIDEIGSKIKLINFQESPEIKDLRQEIKNISSKKVEAVKSQEFEKAALLKSKEDELLTKLKQLEQSASLEAETQWITAVENDVYSVISLASGVPVSRLSASERDKILQMETHLAQKIKGQKTALKRVTEAILRSKAGLQKKSKPIGTFLFLGPTGVGKTQTAKILAEHLFGSEEALIRFDMSEFSEPHSAATLIGSPPGYVGYEEGGKLTEAVKNKPYSVVLFDEIEKAHDTVLTTLLSLLDEGYINDRLGRKVSFKNTVIIMTSNIGARNFADRKTVGFIQSEMPSESEVEALVMQDAKKMLRPEFLNRVDNTIIFQPLSKQTVLEIVDVALNTVHERLAEQGKTLSVTKAARQLLADRGWSLEYGARPLERLIEQEVVQLIALKIIENAEQLHFELDVKSKKFIIK